jgi:hypothetical protein
MSTVLYPPDSCKAYPAKMLGTRQIVLVAVKSLLEKPEHEQQQFYYLKKDFHHTIPNGICNINHMQSSLVLQKGFFSSYCS